ncbi:Leucine-rich repeat flightless-interacting protein 2 [Chelonia mydas]|uniref:Leucine-rich repeat flightless-interacting protein 2 n=1 Tax=Chelonia mydas TaxID=8469 RepID=M7BJT1_CHEMY|nr:Leucine-rich repeat flightless-interacting protein 2 [Chelonia mydas]
MLLLFPLQFLVEPCSFADTDLYPQISASADIDFSTDFSDRSETAADYFSRSNRRGSIVSDVDDVSIPDLNSLEEKCDKPYPEIYTRPASRNSASTTPLSGNSSRRGSGDTSSLVDPDVSLSELRDSLSEVEEKYKKAMVSNAQLDNEKNNLIYQVDTLKDVIEEREEQMAEFYRENEEKSKENQRMQQKIDSITREVFDLQETINWKDKKIGALERQKEYFDSIKHERDELRDELADLKEAMKTGQKHGLVIIPDGTPNGDVNHEPVVGTIAVVSQEAAQVLESAGEGPLDVRLRKLAGEKEELLSQIRKLKLQLEEERQKYSKNDGTNPDITGLENGSDLQLIEMQRDANRQISEYKFKLSKAEQDITTMEQNIGRLEGQVIRYKSAAENAEKVEDELKAEKRKLQREITHETDASGKRSSSEAAPARTRHVAYFGTKALLRLEITLRCGKCCCFVSRSWCLSEETEESFPVECAVEKATGSCRGPWLRTVNISKMSHGPQSNYPNGL